MTAFRILLATIFIGILGYTAVTVMHHGFNLLPVFFGDMLAMAWPGQFNFDFSCLLLLSGLWLAWRHHFTPGGIAMGLLGSLGGAMVLSAYLLYASFAANGDMKEILLGRTRARG